MSKRVPHVVIIGGGFGGLEAARRLARAPVQITLVDRRNHHLFQPLLYQVATAALNPSDIAYPIRAAVRDQANVRVLLAEARHVDVQARTVTLDDGELTYDYLLVATGVTHAYFGKPWQPLAPGLKTVEEALEIRRRVFTAYEAAERETDPHAQRDWLTFVVVGAGPTGVELAGALGEIGLHTLARDFRGIDPTRVRVLLVEGQGRVLGTFPDELSTAARRSLEKRHVEVRTNARVVDMDERGVTIRGADGTVERVGARTILWAAGVTGSPLGADLGATRETGGRVEVGPDLALPAHPEVFVVGDLAKAHSGGKEVPGVAQGAIQGGRHVAAIIAREATQGAPGPRPVFRYRDKGSMAQIGRASAVVEIGRFKSHGLLAWTLWWPVHIMFLVGFRNRFLMMLHWVWSFVTFRRGARLITGETGPLPPVTGIAPDGTLRLPEAAEPVDLPRGAAGPPN